MFSFTKDIGMDLGTASVLIYIKDKGIVLNEPSVVALDKNTGKLLKVGADAQAMLGRTPGNIIAIRPLREGVISDYEVTERMIKEFLHKVMGFQLFKPRIIICVPSGITEVEERAVIDAGIQAGARRVYLIEEPVAAAIGAGIDITQPEGHMIIDIGGGTSDIAVISLSGVVESSSIKIAGDQFNEAVVKYMRRKHNLLVGERTAEKGYYYTEHEAQDGSGVVELGAPFIYKYWDANAAETGKSGMNYALLRYADVLLMMAEAKAQADGGSTTDTDAVEAYYMVRHRALPDEEKPSKIDVNQVLKERFWEICFETQTWYDMLRTRKALNPTTGQIVDLIGCQTPGHTEGARFEEADLLLPYPLREKRLNPNLVRK